MLRAGWSRGTPSPLDAVGAVFVDLTPAWLKDAAIGLFGTADKLALFVGILVVLAILSGLIGLLAARSRVAGLAAVALLVVVAMAAVLARPNSGILDLVPVLVGGAVGARLLWGWCRPILQAPTERGEQLEPAPGLSRRAVLGVALGGAAMTVLGRITAGGTRVVELARAAFRLPPVAAPVTVPAGVEVGVPGVTPFIVPNKEFYRIDTALTVPKIDPAEWSLKVTGLVERELTLDWETLLSKPMQEAMVTLMCVSNEVGGSLNGNAIWTGWPVRELLREAGVRPGADMVLSRSSDGFTAGTPLEALTDDRNALLVVAQNREPLLPEHGFPVRLVVPGLYGYVSATKWVTELKVTRFADDQGYWTPRGWSALGPVKTNSRIDVPSSGARLGAGTVAVAGVAWAQHRGIIGVQVSVDGGPWTDTRLGTDATVDAWRQWAYTWPATPGRHTIAVRAIDATGTPETAARALPAPDGASGHHTITVTVA
ncbi:oxidoreductase [Enemella dayhoffiae]|uniref:Oxidoreductase n=2 Tax=Enemella dayhoffiae TaxID=2016507 RepID=A0A255HAL1_9ACTN|nr:oxidoreductase [Enemella dayhoffiae]